MTAGKRGVGALGAAGCGLQRPEQLLLEEVSGPLVELVVDVAERGQRAAELLHRIGDARQQVLPGLLARVRHSSAGDRVEPPPGGRERRRVEGAEHGQLVDELLGGALGVLLLVVELDPDSPTGAFECTNALRTVRSRMGPSDAPGTCSP